MIKLRYLGSPHFLRLQYRTLRPNQSRAASQAPNPFEGLDAVIAEAAVDEVERLRKVLGHAQMFVLFVAKQFGEFCEGAPWEGWEEMAQQFGLVETVPYDPDAHSNMGNCNVEPGDDICVLTDQARAVIAKARVAAKLEVDASGAEGDQATNHSGDVA